jgi:hypothetical protein
MLRYRDLFLLGAAFLLLETKSVTGFALLFGTTWVVNALVFAVVLLAVLAAVEVTKRRSARYSGGPRPSRRAGWPRTRKSRSPGCDPGRWMHRRRRPLRCGCRMARR